MSFLRASIKQNKQNTKGINEPVSSGAIQKEGTFILLLSMYHYPYYFYLNLYYIYLNILSILIKMYLLFSCSFLRRGRKCYAAWGCGLLNY